MRKSQLKSGHVVLNNFTRQVDLAQSQAGRQRRCPMARYGSQRSSQRSSVRSRTSSSPSDVYVDPRERVKDYCRRLVAFLFTHVGVTVLVVLYTVAGALGLPQIEKQQDTTNIRLVSLEHSIRSNVLVTTFFRHSPPPLPPLQNNTTKVGAMIGAHLVLISVLNTV